MSDRWNRIVNVAILATLAILLLNPSGVVGRWVTSAYSGWQTQRRIDNTWDRLVAAPSFLGPPPGDHRAVIVEFVDYDCQVCQTVAPAVSEATRTHGASVVVRHVPSMRGGPVSVEAALAAICAERFDLFPEAHDALLSERTWFTTRDWGGLAASLGVEDSESLVDCMRDETTQDRLALDRAFADHLGVRVTPTFVAGGELHAGASGLVSALTAMSQPADSEVGVRIRTLGESVFDSSEHPDLSELLSIVGGLFLPDSGLALVERNEIHMVDLVSGEDQLIGRRGEGPREFGHIWTANHTPQGILVWDTLRRRAVFVAHNGEFLTSQGYRQAPFQDVFTSRPVGVGADGRIVFRDGPGMFGRFGEGRVWDPAWYVAVDEGGALQRIAEAKGEEIYYGQHRSDAVTMGHRTFEAVTEDHLIIADTYRGAIAVLDWSGSEVAEIPMPMPVRLSAAQVRAGREWRVSQKQRSMAWVRRAVASGQLPEMAGREDDADVAQAYADWPINELVPAVDTLLTDFDARLWVRDYRLPDQDSVTWRVWDIGKAKPLFTVRMDGDDRLLDAHGDLLLLRRVNALDVPRAEVRRLTGVPQ